MDGGWGGIKSEGNKGKRSGRGGVWRGLRTMKEGTVYISRQAEAHMIKEFQRNISFMRKKI